MRPTKFRFFCEGHGMSIPYCLKDLLTGQSVITADGTNIVGSIRNDPLISIMQFTGLHDKNSKEIYEGDILKVPHEIYKMGRAWDWEGKDDGLELVYWDDKCLSFMSKDLLCCKEWKVSHQQLDGRYMWVLDIPKHSEIIGNIHEKPELLHDYN